MLRPCGPRVLIVPEVETDPIFDSAAKAGLALLKEADEEQKRLKNAVVRGTVHSIGSEAFKPPIGDGTPWCAVGDKIYFAKYAGKIVIDPETEEEFLALNDEDLVLAITGEKNG